MNLPPGGGGPSEVYVRDLAAGTTREVSVSSSGTQSNNDTYAAAITSDGRYAAFASGADNLVTGDTNQQSDVFLRGPLH